jgi:hypothetical protein
MGTFLAAGRASPAADQTSRHTSGDSIGAVRHNAGMDVTTEISYLDARLSDVVAMMFDPEFRGEVCRATHAIDSSVDVQAGPDGSTVVTVHRTLPAEVPDFVKRFVGQTLELVQSETWAPDDGSGTRRATVALQVVGQPATMTGEIVLTETPDGVHETVHGRLKVAVPLFGGRIESELAKGIVAAAAEEERAGRAWLAR